MPEQGPGGPQLQQLQAQPRHAPCQARARYNFNYQQNYMKMFVQTAPVCY